MLGVCSRGRDERYFGGGWVGVGGWMLEEAGRVVSRSWEVGWERLGPLKTDGR